LCNPNKPAINNWEVTVHRDEEEKIAVLCFCVDALQASPASWMSDHTSPTKMVHLILSTVFQVRRRNSFKARELLFQKQCSLLGFPK
jgi:hypothetical protein